jgi:hypothetical protein
MQDTGTSKLRPLSIVDCRNSGRWNSVEIAIQRTRQLGYFVFTLPVAYS